MTDKCLTITDKSKTITEIFIAKMSKAVQKKVVQTLNFMLLMLTVAAEDGDEDRWIKAWIWVCSSQSYRFWRLQFPNKIDSFCNYVAFLVYFMVLLSVTACRRKCLLCPTGDKVNITW